jgi:hypothetical protein
MKNKVFSIGIFVLFVLLATAWTADVSGKWSAKTGDVDIILTLVADGTTLTGTVNNPQAGEAPIKDGKVSGEDISFHVVRTINENEMRIVWKGKIAGDEIKFTREVQGQEGSATAFTAKRVK